jgi:hypothetical protein
VAHPTAATIRGLAMPELKGDDELIDTLVSAAIATLARYCLWPATTSDTYTFESSSYTLYFDGPDRDDDRRLTLGLRPVTAITAITQDTAGTWTYGETVTENTDALLDKHLGCLYAWPGSGHVWITGLRAIKVSCTAGYDVSAEPPLVQAIALLVGHWSRLASAGTSTLSAQLGGSSVSLRSDDLPASVRQLVAPYRLVERETHWRHG